MEKEQEFCLDGCLNYCFGQKTKRTNENAYPGRTERFLAKHQYLGRPNIVCTMTVLVHFPNNLFCVCLIDRTKGITYRAREDTPRE